MLQIFHTFWAMNQEKIFNIVFTIIIVIAFLQVVYRLIVHKKSAIIWIGIIILLPTGFSLSKKYLLVQRLYQKMQALLHGSFTDWIYAVLSFAMMLGLIMLGYSALVNLLDSTKKHTNGVLDNHADNEEDS